MEILYEDNHILAFNKPAGIKTQDDGLERTAKNFIKERDQKPGAVFLHAVHRLDTPVSGIVIFAKTSKALSRLNASIRNGEVKKNYLALLPKAPEPLHGTLSHFIFHGNRKAIISEKEKKCYKPCTLSYKTLAVKDDIDCLDSPIDYEKSRAARIFHIISDEDDQDVLSDLKRAARGHCQTDKTMAASDKDDETDCLDSPILCEKYGLISIDLITGRYHQIRAQFAYIGLAILGDVKYGAKPIPNYPGIALHHSNCVFSHPVKKRRIEIYAPIPDCFQIRKCISYKKK